MRLPPETSASDPSEEESRYGNAVSGASTLGVRSYRPARAGNVTRVSGC